MRDERKDGLKDGSKSEDEGPGRVGVASAQHEHKYPDVWLRVAAAEAEYMRQLSGVTDWIRGDSRHQLNPS